MENTIIETGNEVNFTRSGFSAEPGKSTKEIMRDIDEVMDDAIAFHRNDRYDHTRLVSRTFDGINRLYIKDEYGRKGLMAFKIMGVEYAIHRLFEETGHIDPNTVLTTMTDGNHGAAVAYVAKKYGVKAIIFVPKNMTQERMKRIEERGAELRVVDGMYDDAIAEVRREAKKNQWIVISDTAWDGYESIPKYISTGYCAIFNEAIDQISELPIEKGGYPTHIFLQTGVGGFPSAGVAYAVLRLNPRPKLICVEPSDADCVYENIKQGCYEGTMMSKGNTDSIMSGLNCGLPSTTAWPILRDYVDMYITIGDNWARKAVRALYHHPKRVMAGESGAAGLAGLMACLDTPELKEKLDLNSESNVLIVSTEGVTDKSTFNDIIGYPVFD